MNMIYEGVISYVTVDSKGNDKQVKESYAFEHMELFGGVEIFLYKEFECLTDLDVIAIKRINVKEIVNKRSSSEELIWEATMQDVFTNENGEETYTKYKVLLFAKSFDEAKSFVTEYMKQGFDMTLISLKLTKFVDIFS